jgi:chemotaxis protein MotB
MMAFFMVMWLVGQNKPMKEAVAGYFRDPFGVGQGPGGASGGGGDPRNREASKDARIQLLLAANRDALKHTQEDADAIASKKAFLLKLHDGQRTTVGTLVTFADDTARLDEAAQKRLAELAPLLRGKPNKIEIRGHAANAPLPQGSAFHDAWDLCYARCQATRDLLLEQCIEPDRIRLSQAGTFEPQTCTELPGTGVRNGRVEVYLLKEHVEELKGTKKEREALSHAEKHDSEH